MTNNRLVEPQHTDAAISDIPGGQENLSPGMAYVTKHGRHNQLINASVLEKVTQQRRQNMEESQHSKVLRQDQWERSQMHQYLESLSEDHTASDVQIQSAPGSKVHEIAVDGLTFQILNGGTKLGRIYGRMASRQRYNIRVLTKIRRQVAKLANPGSAADPSNDLEVDNSDLSSDGEDSEVAREDVDSDDLPDDIVEGTELPGRHTLAEQDDFVGF
ncbi:MAG: hypothetical protein Q9220_003292 [cf. Caloplaca sp. 1 TL-2023]